MKAAYQNLCIWRLLIKYSKPYRKHIKDISAYCFIPMLVICLYIMYNSYVTTVELHFFKLYSNRDGTRVPSVCELPDYNPYDSSIIQYIHPWSPVRCGENQPYLTYVDYDGYLYLNLSGVEVNGRNAQDYNCTYFEIKRCNGTDDKVELAVIRIMRRKEKLDHPFVIVQCKLTSTGKLVYETGHAFVVGPSVNLLAKTAKLRPDRPNILMLGLDSMSRLNFIRQLPKTYNFLIHQLDSVVLSGLTKVGHNTYPNILTMLTGIAARKVPGVNVPYWGEENANGFFDDLPHAWKQFDEEGYITMYSEDWPEWTAFNYMAKGFVHEPVDYYMRPFWIAIEALRNVRSSDKRCFGNIPQYTYLFNYTEEFIKKIRNLPYFAFSFLTGYSHNYLNSIQVIDDDLEKMFRNMFSRGDLKKTIVIVMGDHGNRYDAIRQTTIGRVEERMPFFSVALPQGLRKQYPHLQRNLQKNSRVLLSWFDVYELLMDVAKDNFKEESSVERWGVVGYSPFRPVPRNRTCAQAGIPYNYCICQREITLETQDTSVLEMARDLVTQVNGLLSTVKKGTCAPLVLNKIKSAQLILPNIEVAQPEKFVALYRVTVEVAPSEGILEGTLEKNAWSSTGKLIGDVNRINKYGNQSHCIRNKILKLYCYCTDLLREKDSAGV